MSAYCQSPRNYYHRFLIAGSFFWSIVFFVCGQHNVAVHCEGRFVD